MRSVKFFFLMFLMLRELKHPKIWRFQDGITSLILHLSGMLEILDLTKTIFNDSVALFFFFLACSTQLEVQTEHSKRARFGRDEGPPECPIREGRFLTPTITRPQYRSW